MARNWQKLWQRKPLSLSVRVSLLLMLAAMLPVLFTVIFIVLLARPALIAQTSQEMRADARTHAQLIDNFFAERILEVEALSSLQPVQAFLQSGEGAEEAKASLAGGRGRGSYYENWTLLGPDGEYRLSYPFEPLKHGDFYILPEDLSYFPKDAAKESALGKRSIISSVFYNASAQDGYIDIYSPVINEEYKPLGILRFSFDIHYIWDIVNQEVGVNGEGSYAFILDENGVCIAHSNFDAYPYSNARSPNLFHAVAPYSEEIRQRIDKGQIYGGGTGGELPLLENKVLADFHASKSRPTTFQMVPPGQQEEFQVVHSATYSACCWKISLVYVMQRE